MQNILAYLLANPGVWLPYLIPPVLAALAAFTRWLSKMGPFGIAVAGLLDGLGLDAAKVGKALAMLWDLARKKRPDVTVAVQVGGLTIDPDKAQIPPAKKEGE